ncbi:hypothetical protein GC170_01245 [bacterium]|nr:hypothetical protein [bacterium]
MDTTEQEQSSLPVIMIAGKRIFGSEYRVPNRLAELGPDLSQIHPKALSPESAQRDLNKSKIVRSRSAFRFAIRSETMISSSVAATQAERNQIWNENAVQANRRVRFRFAIESHLMNYVQLTTELRNEIRACHRRDRYRGNRYDAESWPGTKRPEEFRFAIEPHHITLKHFTPELRNEIGSVFKLWFELRNSSNAMNLSIFRNWSNRSIRMPDGVWSTIRLVMPLTVA